MAAEPGGRERPVKAEPAMKEEPGATHARAPPTDPVSAAATSSSSSSSTSSFSPATAASPATSPKCPYLDTVDRKTLDFDMDKVCSVTLQRQNVYACLVCGKFFAGRGRASPAYTHSLQAEHYVFMNLHDGRMYCLPDGYEVRDASLDDVRFALAPTFASRDLAELDRNVTLSVDQHGNAYLPGFVGLNNLRHTDYVSVIVHTLAHVEPVRDFFLRPERFAACTSALVHSFGDLLRRLWSPRAFKSSVSPHEFIHQLTLASKGAFRADQQADAAVLLTWLLNTLHRDLLYSYDKVGAGAEAARLEGRARAKELAKLEHLGAGGVAAPTTTSTSSSAPAPAGRWWAAGGNGPGRSVITEAFQGELEVTSLIGGGRVRSRDELEAIRRKKLAAERARGRAGASAGVGASESKGSGGDGDGDGAPGGDAAGAASRKRRRRGDGDGDGNGDDGDDDEDDDNDDDNDDDDDDDEGSAGVGNGEADDGVKTAPDRVVVTRVPFLCLALDLPPVPLFTDEAGESVIPEVPLLEVLAKYGGSQVVDASKDGIKERRRYVITRFPSYLVLHLRRFATNSFYVEKNGTIVTFPARNLELRSFLHPDSRRQLRHLARAHASSDAHAPSSSSSSSSTSSSSKALDDDGHIRSASSSSSSSSSSSFSTLPPLDPLRSVFPPLADLPRLSVRQMRWLASCYGLGEAAAACTEKRELLALVRLAYARAVGTKFDLVASVCHDTFASEASPDVDGDTGGVSTDFHASDAASAATNAAATAATVGAGRGIAAHTASSATSRTRGRFTRSTLQGISGRHPVELGTYRVHVPHDASRQLFEIRDLDVRESVAQLVSLSESYILVYRRQAWSAQFPFHTVPDPTRETSDASGASDGSVLKSEDDHRKEDSSSAQGTGSSAELARGGAGSEGGGDRAASDPLHRALFGSVFELPSEGIGASTTTAKAKTKSWSAATAASAALLRRRTGHGPSWYGGGGAGGGDDDEDGGGLYEEDED